jgi:hypothetical protein
VVVISLIGQMGERAMSEATEAEKKAAEEEKRKKEGPFSIEEVLADEAKELHGDTEETKTLISEARGQVAEEKRKNLNADKRGLNNRKDPDVQSRGNFYVTLNKLNQAALCCSGGGIRSATFCLGIIQAFANYDVDAGVLRGKAAAIARSNESGAAAPPGHQAGETVGSKPKTYTPIDPKDSALGRFHYLSTVSGGGYIGSWLSAWRSRSDFSTVIRNLTGRPNGPDIEPPEISWLRAYSNYLTPTLGITSADSWAAVAICVRNLILNWLVIIPIVCLVLLSLKLVATVSIWVAHNVGGPEAITFARASVWIAHYLVDPWAMTTVALIGATFLIVAQGFTNSHRPSRRSGPGDAAHGKFILFDLIWAVASAILLTIFFTSHFFWLRLEHVAGSVVQRVGLTDILHRLVVDLKLDRLDVDLKFKFLAMTAIAGLLVYSIGWIVGLLVRIGYGFTSWLRSSKGEGWRDFMSGLRSGERWRDFFSWLRFREGWRDFFCWAASGLVYGALIGLGAYLFHLLTPYPAEPKKLLVLLLAMTLGVPWFLMSQLVAGIVFAGLASYEDKSDPDREWLGRAGGWVAAVAVAWALVAFLVFDGGYFVQIASGPVHKYIVASGGVIGVISGIVTALLGSSSSTAAKKSSTDQGSFKSTSYNVLLALAGPIFVAVLIVALSVALDRLLLGDALVNEIQTQTQRTATTLSWWEIGGWLTLGLVIAAVVGGLASFFVNINRFSLHALYRNRLTRCYLGASNQNRDPDEFSGFDFNDNLCVSKLWPPKLGDSVNPLSLFHVVNIALNVVSTKRLAWQERKAESFTVSPLHCGAAYLGFRVSEDYGGQTKDRAEAKAAEAEAKAAKAKAEAAKAEAAKAEAKAEAKAKAKATKAEATKAEAKATEAKVKAAKVESGLSLGTALAISGAAVSPNMGYHSSPSIALLLTLFNVRLGWWLGNPGKAGQDTYTAEGPKLAVEPLFAEAFGLTNDDSPYVYLSDGGHFENLGLYEMVRRRCRLIVVVDAGCDPDFAFEDLGNAVRKIYIDLGIRITFRDLGSLADRPSVKSRSRAKRDAAALAIIDSADKTKGSKIAAPGDTPYHAVGVIHYREADHAEPGAHDKTDKTAENGYILYIKPAYHGTEKSAGIRSYATANPTFPHETTADQWFTESQLESYRSLGLDIGSRILNHDIVLKEGDWRQVGNQQVKEPDFTLHAALKALKIGP